MLHLKKGIKIRRLLPLLIEYTLVVSHDVLHASDISTRCLVDPLPSCDIRDVRRWLKLFFLVLDLVKVG